MGILIIFLTHVDKELEILTQKSLVTILAYAPTGLGHLRVTDSLYHGLPSEVTPLLLGSQDRRLTVIHRIGSMHPLSQRLMTWLQQGWAQDWLYKGIYLKFLLSHLESLSDQLLTILEQRIDLPKTVLIVSTHYGLIHQLSRIKVKLAKKLEIKIILVVIVTDDSPQHIWYTEGADLTFVPSERTKSELLRYANQAKLPKIRIEVVPYPVSPLLSVSLSQNRWDIKKSQVDPQAEVPIHLSLPVSGAAVGLGFLRSIIDKLHEISPRFTFHIVSKSASYTHDFLTEMLIRKYVTLYTSLHDREVVDRYIELYQKQVIALEITKPSEQTFKALLTPQMKGGSLLLFSRPIGRQEFDNLFFLRRHHLLPTTAETISLHHRCNTGNSLHDDIEGKKLLQESQFWRGIELPNDPQYAARFIHWCLSQGIFKEMLNNRMVRQSNDRHAHELNSNGVKIIWQRVAQHLNEIK